MNRLKYVIVIVILAAAGAGAQVTAIKAGRLFDAEQGVMLANQVILVKDGRITAVGAGIGIPKEARVIDLSSMTVLPGLLDMHTHLIGPPNDPDPLHELERTSAEEVMRSLPNPPKVLLAGFTTVRDVGTYRALTDISMRDAIARGDVVGPRMFVAGAYVTITGGAGAVTGFAPDVILPWDMHYGEANSPWEGRQRVRMLAGQGVDFIKVLSTGAVLTHNSNANAREFTDEELNAIVDEAHNFGFKVAAHAHNAAGIKAAVRAGVNSIEHGSYLDEEGVQLMIQHGTYLVPTLETGECINAASGYPADFLEHSDRLEGLSLQNFTRAVKEGVKIAFGTDISVCPFGFNAREFTWMVKYGMTPAAALQAATVNAADLLGQTANVGSIKPGKYADIIAVKGDPLADISIMEKVQFVMKAGVVYKGP